MFKQLADWLETRTGYRGVVHEALDEPIPGGARWRYVFGSALTTTFLIQLVTGLLLMTSYSPSSTTAWGSVFYISYSMSGGWLLRGIHHFGSQAMVVLLVMHLVQVLLAGAYRAPREVNWWFGLALMFITLGFSLTGYLLPWDQKGYWATKVATNIAGGAPLLGPYIQKVIVGGQDYGNLTLTRFYGLHVGVLPILLAFCLVAHVALFRKHGLTPPREPGKVVGKFWPEQVFMDTVAGAVVLGVLIFLVVREGGANLDAPADPSSESYPARPEWYFLSLFQMLKKFSGKFEYVGTFVVPGAIATILLLLPLFDKMLPRRLAHFFACGFVFALLGGAGYLTVEALRSDERDASFQQERLQADSARDRALRLADSEGIAPEGSAYLLMRDPYTRGRGVLEKNCLGCHHHNGKGAGRDAEKMSPQTASDLKNFGTRSWARGLLEDPSGPAYFGKTPQCQGMAAWKKTSKLSAAELDQVADFVALFAQVDPETSPEEWVNDPKLKVAEHPGLASFVKECLACHQVGEPGLLTDKEPDKLQDAPDLFGWGSNRWITRMIKKPGAPRLYGFLEKKDQMPPFEEQLSENDLNMVIRYIKNDFVPPSR